MFEKLLLAVDGSKAGEAAIAAATGLATATGAKVLVIHVESSGGPTPDPQSAAKAAEFVAAVVSRLGAHGVTASGDIQPAPRGDVGRVIVDVAHDAEADTIVVGSRGLTDAKALMLGSVAHDVIQQFHGRVLVAR